jgi:hypothetical protein
MTRFLPFILIAVAMAVLAGAISGVAVAYSVRRGELCFEDQFRTSDGCVAWDDISAR